MSSEQNDLQNNNKFKGGSANVHPIERIVSVLGGSALIAYGVTQRKPVPLALAGLGAALVGRGATGHCPVYTALHTGSAKQTESENASVPHDQGIKVEHTVTINKTPAELFHFWRSFDNLPKFMDHLESVTIQDDTHSHWVVKAPAGRTVAWDAEIINEVHHELIAWKSLEGADVDNAGSVHFTAAPTGGTEVRVVLEYRPPAGKIGAAVAKLFGENPQQQIESDLRKFKSVMEAGEVPTNGAEKNAVGIS
ncbi:MAG: SRPBCC family protein [Capsulimonas sp.]|uniref:SRPBCC family protein n=1 Tax=Capsulimonas sp. TaxID=2494211 RepID=UPI003266044F